MVRTQVNTSPYGALFIPYTDAIFTASVFTQGRGTNIICGTIQDLANCILGKSLAELTNDMAKTWRLVDSGQIRWIGPDVSHSLARRANFSSELIIV